METVNFLNLKLKDESPLESAFNLASEVAVLGKNKKFAFGFIGFQFPQYAALNQPPVLSKGFIVTSLTGSSYSDIIFRAVYRLSQITDSNSISKSAKKLYSCPIFPFLLNTKLSSMCIQHSNTDTELLISHENVDTTISIENVDRTSIEIVLSSQEILLNNDFLEIYPKNFSSIFQVFKIYSQKNYQNLNYMFRSDRSRSLLTFTVFNESREISMLRIPATFANSEDFINEDFSVSIKLHQLKALQSVYKAQTGNHFVIKLKLYDNTKLHFIALEQNGNTVQELILMTSM